MDQEYKYEKKLVAFVDILGFRNKTDATEGYAKKPVHLMLSQIRQYIRMHNHTSIINIPNSHYYVFSDSSMFSAKEDDFDNLIYIIAQLQFLTATNGFFLRGGLTYDYIYDENEYFYGRGMNRAYEMESKEAVYPRIIIDFKEDIKDYVKNNDWILQDEDGKYYIDFLREVTEGSVAIRYTNLYSRYNYDTIRDYIIKELRESKETKIREKYIWLTKYFNYFIEKNGIDCEKIAIDSLIQY